MKTLATIFGALALMTWGAAAQEGPVPATAADVQPALAAPAAIPAVEVQPAAEIQPAAPAAEAVQPEALSHSTAMREQAIMRNSVPVSVISWHIPIS